MKKAGYVIYALIYNFVSLFGQASNRVFFVATHNSSETGNCGAVIDELKKRGGYIIYKMTREDEDLKNPISFLKFMFVMPFKMARCSTIFYDKTFLPLAYFKPRKSVKHCMLWHGTGAIKKFGLDVSLGQIKELELAANSKLTHLFVSSEGMIPLHKTAFGINESKIYVTGLPRTDCLFSYPKSEYSLKDKKCINILYAPTFRDTASGNEQIMQRAIELAESFANKDKTDSQYSVCFMVRFHPFFANKCSDIFYSRYLKLEKSKLMIDASEWDLNETLKETDVLITDYSSIFFDFAILNRKMIFYPFDFNSFVEKERGLYFDYNDFVPGPILTKSGEIAALVDKLVDKTNDNKSFGKDTYEDENYVKFMDFSYKYRDSDSAKRVVDLVFDN